MADISNKKNGALYVEELVRAINRFRAWQAARFPDREPCKISGEWETWYGGWTEISMAFCKVLQEVEPEAADQYLLDEMVYIIARDNECELLIDELSGYSKWFSVLCRHCLGTEEAAAKWQFVSYLASCECGHEAKELLLAFAADPNEYVCRRALLVMPSICPEQAAYYAELFWNRELYAPELREYQRMAALTVLYEIHSPHLDVYLGKVREDGGKYLRQCAEKIEDERRG